MKPIPNFHGYFADEQGNIYSMKNNWDRARPSPKLLKKQMSGTGYYIVILCINHKHYSKYIHRLILETFTGECPKGMQACHNDGKVTNNNIFNLRWDTHKNNLNDRRKHGTIGLGEKSSNHKLNEVQVKIIRRFYKMEKGRKGTLTYLANLFDCSVGSIFDVAHNKRWLHVK